MRKTVSIFILITLLFLPLSGCVSVDEKEFDLSESDDPVPYEEDEFPQWAQEVRRAEIIFAGSLPFTILLSNAGYGIYNLLSAGSSGTGSITSITSSSAMTNAEKTQVLAIGAGISACFALADYIIGLFNTDENDE